MSKLSELIWDKEGFEVKLHCENRFDDEAYTQIKQELTESSAVWKESGSVPIEDMVALMGVVDTLGDNSEHYDDTTAIKVEDARIEIQKIITDLLD